MTDNVITLDMGRKRLAEAQEARKRFERRRTALGLSSASTSFPTASDDSWNPEVLPKWPGGIDDLEVGE